MNKFIIPASTVENKCVKLRPNINIMNIFCRVTEVGQPPSFAVDYQPAAFIGMALLWVIFIIGYVYII